MTHTINKIETISQAIISWLERLGIRYVFTVPGMLIDPFLNTLTAQNNISIMVACHETGAGFMADGYYRASATPGVCLAIGGPGASNFLPSAIVARIDKSAVLYITGSPPSFPKGYSPFQDTGHNGSRDNENFTTAIDFSFFLNETDKINTITDNLTNILERRLPAHLNLPYNIQLEIHNDSNYKNEKELPAETLPVEELIQLLLEYSHPVLLIGDLLLRENDTNVLSDFAEATQTYIATTIGAKGSIAEDHTFALGNFGYAGSVLANQILLGEDCDAIIVMGIDFNQRESFNWDSRILNNNKALIRFHLNDTPPSNLFSTQYLTTSFKKLLSQTTKRIKGSGRSMKRENWVYYPPQPEKGIRIPSSKELNLYCVLIRFRELASRNTILMVDSGAHRISAAQAWKAYLPNTFFSSDQQAPMGWAIGASIGIKAAKPSNPVIVVTGDGCMRMHGIEIATAVRYKLPIIFLVSNNNSYKIIERRKNTETEKRLQSDLPFIDWVQFGKSMGTDGMVLDNVSDVDEVFHHAFNSPIPFIIDLRAEHTAIDHITETLPAKIWPDCI